MVPSRPLQTSQAQQIAQFPQTAPAAQPAQTGQPAPVRAIRPVPQPVIATAHCDLCGEPLSEHAGHFAMTSPLTARKVTVCRTCRRAALSEGYRPRA